jgi:phosphoribosylaminoimidazole-succinocarboxamide synthase
LPPLLSTSLPGLTLTHRGKVRDIYELDGNLLFIATDRISAFDCVLPSGIPDKGRVLTQMSLFWFHHLQDLVPNHLLTADLDAYPPSLLPFRGQLEGRSMLVKKATMFPVECVARGYVSGSGWKDYQRTGAICGVSLPPGLKESDQLPEPIFTPATKAESGHDENISFDQAANIIGHDTAQSLKDLTLKIYSIAAAYALKRGIILADTKFEFGMIDGQITLGDEVLTPDSSRYWPAESYSPGRPQKSFDKQFVRDYLETLDWNKQPPAPPLPDDVVAKTAAKYREAYETLTGASLSACRQ